MKILVKLPTKKRKEKLFTVLDKFYSLCENISLTQFVITMDDDDNIMNTPETQIRLKSYQNLNYDFGYSSSKLYATNRDLEKYTDWDILVLASDDTVPLVYGWDTVLRNKMLTHFPDTDGVLHFSDGHQKQNLNTLPIVGKKYFDRFGYIQYEGYKSCWADVEFMDVSRILDRVVYFDEVIIEHQHPDWGYGERDFVHKENLDNFKFDQSLYLKRKNINFEL